MTWCEFGLLQQQVLQYCGACVNRYSDGKHHESDASTGRPRLRAVQSRVRCVVRSATTASTVTMRCSLLAASRQQVLRFAVRFSAAFRRQVLQACSANCWLPPGGKCLSRVARVLVAIPAPSAVASFEARFWLQFNVDVSKWDVSSVNNMVGMSASTTKFNIDTSKWDVSSVNNVIDMFASMSAASVTIAWRDSGLGLCAQPTPHGPKLVSSRVFPAFDRTDHGGSGEHVVCDGGSANKQQS